jgi:hypothetical protein
MPIAVLLHSSETCHLIAAKWIQYGRAGFLTEPAALYLTVVRSLPGSRLVGSDARLRLLVRRITGKPGVTRREQAGWSRVMR